MESAREFEGKTMDDVVRKACQAFGVQRQEDLVIDVLENTRRFFSIMGGAKVRISAKLKSFNTPPSAASSATAAYVAPAPEIPSTAGEIEDSAIEVNGKIMREVPRREDGRRPRREGGGGRPARGRNEGPRRHGRDRAMNTEGTDDVDFVPTPFTVVTELTPAAAKAKEVVEQIIKLIDPEASIETLDREGELVLDIRSQNSGLIIGRNGDTLSAIQFMVSKILLHGDLLNGQRIVVDTQNYRDRRKRYLIGLAIKSKVRALKSRKPVTLDISNSYERWVIHNHLVDDREVYTKSIGEGQYRKLVIYPGVTRHEPNVEHIDVGEVAEDFEE